MSRKSSDWDKRVLEAKGLPTDEWESYAGVVQEAVRILLTGTLAR